MGNTYEDNPTREGSNIPDLCRAFVNTDILSTPICQTPESIEKSKNKYLQKISQENNLHPLSNGQRTKLNEYVQKIRDFPPIEKGPEFEKNLERLARLAYSVYDLFSNKDPGYKNPVEREECLETLIINRGISKRDIKDMQAERSKR